MEMISIYIYIYIHKKPCFTGKDLLQYVFVICKYIYIYLSFMSSGTFFESHGKGVTDYQQNPAAK